VQAGNQATVRRVMLIDLDDADDLAALARALRPHLLGEPAKPEPAAPVSPPAYPLVGKRLLSADELSHRVHRSTGSIRRDRKAGMPAHLVGNSFRFVEEEVMDWYRERGGTVLRLPLAPGPCSAFAVETSARGRAQPHRLAMMRFRDARCAFTWADGSTGDGNGVVHTGLHTMEVISLEPEGMSLSVAEYEYRSAMPAIMAAVPSGSDVYPRRLEYDDHGTWRWGIDLYLGRPRSIDVHALSAALNHPHERPVRFGFGRFHFFRARCSHYRGLLERGDLDYWDPADELFNNWDRL
jgi:hypothetical protein